MLSHFGSQATQSKGKARASGSKDLFVKTLQECGAVCENGVVSIECSPVTLRVRLECRLKQMGHVPSVVKNFTTGFLEFTEPAIASADEEAREAFRPSQGLHAFGGTGARPVALERFANLKALLIQVVQVERDEDSARNHTVKDFRIASNYSIAKILLSINILQSKMIDILMAKIPQVMNVAVPENASLNENLPRLILHQFRFLDSVSDSKLLTAKLVDLLEATGREVNVQRDVIECIPEIMPDCGLKDIVIALKVCMETNDDVTVAVLDTLGTIGLPSDLLPDIMETVLGALVEPEVESLPVIIKFLFQTGDPDNIAELVSKIREAMSLQTVSEILNAKESVGSGATLIFDTLKSGIIRQKLVLDAWLALIIDLKQAENHKPIDVIILLLLRSEISIQKRVDKIYRQKVEGGLLPDDVIRKAIVAYFKGLQQYFPSILSLTESLVREDKQYHGVASMMYRSCFSVFDTHNRQQLIGCIVAHIGSGIPSEVDCGLNILLDLTNDCAEAVLKFSIFVKSLLDYLDQLGIHQIRVLYEIFAALALHKPIEAEDEASEAEITFESGLLSDMRIIIRKQLGSDDPKFKQMGVLGAMALIKRLVSVDSEGLVKTTGNLATAAGGSSNIKNQAAQQSSVSCKVAIKFVEQIYRSCEHGSIQCLTLLFDELSYLIGHSMLQEKFIAWINDSFSETFVNHFLIDEPIALLEKIDVADVKGEIWFQAKEEENSTGREEMVPETIFTDVVEATIKDCEIEEESEPEITNCISILPLAAWAFTGKSTREIPRVLSSDEAMDEDENERGQLSLEKQLIMLLPASLKFLQVSELASRNSLLGLGQVLNMGLVMFEKDTMNVAMTSLTAEVCCSAVFAAINLFHETLNAFSKKSVLNDADLPDCAQKCLARVRHLLELESYLEKLMAHAPRWAPVGFFRDGDLGQDELLDLPDPSEDDIVDEDTQLPAAAGTRKSQKSKKGKAKLKIASRFSKPSELKPIMRELEIDVFNLLTDSHLRLPTPDNMESLKAGDGIEDIIQFPELRFFLNELKFKLEYLTGSQAKEKANTSRYGLLLGGSVGFSNLVRIDTKELVLSLAALAPVLCSALESAYTELRKAQQEHEQIGEALDRQHIQTVWDTFDAVLKCFTLMLQWPALKKSKLRVFLLKSVAMRGNPDLDLIPTQGVGKTIEKCAVEAHQYFMAFKDHLPSIGSSILLLKLLIELHSLCLPESDTLEVMRKEVGVYAKEQLSSNWEEKKNRVDLVTSMLPAQIQNSDCSTEIIFEYASIAFKGLFDQNEHVCAKYPMLDKTIFPTFYKIVFQELITVVDQLKTDAPIPDEQYVDRVTDVAQSFRSMVELVKRISDDGKILSILLRTAKGFVASFVKNVLPPLTRSFKSMKADVLGVFKVVQGGTRILQALVNEVKSKKDMSLLPHVPPLRKVLEAFLFEVKKHMIDNDTSGFTMANLKIKNLRGETVPSEITDSDNENQSEREEKTKRKRNVKKAEKAAATQSEAQKRRKTSPENSKTSGDASDSSGDQNDELEQGEETEAPQDDCEGAESDEGDKQVSDCTTRIPIPEDAEDEDEEEMALERPRNKGKPEPQSEPDQPDEEDNEDEDEDPPVMVRVSAEILVNLTKR
ncbi:Fanconi anaemia protein FancD2 nuclease-domain-containing protein [Chytriomyces sp. MP71]|nr:Fanconi anaemia protein FancD2 nuclease-domain-containing protein [Chytriomyces sp. MP71]